MSLYDLVFCEDVFDRRKLAGMMKKKIPAFTPRPRDREPNLDAKENPAPPPAAPNTSIPRVIDRLRGRR